MFINFIVFFFLLLLPFFSFSDELIDNDTSINFSVTVTPSSCIVDWPGDVDFGENPDFPLNNSVEKNFYIKFRDCTTSSAIISFSGSYLDIDNNLILNCTSPDCAKNIGILILDENGKDINLTKGWSSDSLSTQSENNIKFIAKLIEFGGRSSAGLIKTHVDLMVSYN